MYKCLFAITVYSVFITGIAQAQITKTAFNRITIRDGLSQSTVNHIIQDIKEFIRFVTYSGINKYKGYIFKAYRNFAALHYTEPGKNKYAYKMEQFDQDWVQRSADHHYASYTNLPAGEYDFKVKAANNDDYLNEMKIPMKIIISLPFWQTWWFRIISILIILGSILGWYEWRINRSRRQREALEIQVAKRIQELSNKTTELEDERYLLNLIINSIPDLIYVKDRKSRLTRMNLAYANRLGDYTPEELLGKTDFDIFSNEHSRQAFNDEQKIIKTGKPLLDYIEKETWENAPDTWVSSSKMPYKDKNGEIIGLIGISKNITKLVQTEMALRKSKKNLELAKKETDNILHNVKEGFFLLNKNYQISSQYSTILESIFSCKNIAYLNFLEFISDKIAPNDLENTKDYLSLLFDVGVQEEAFASLNPLSDIEFKFNKKYSQAEGNGKEEVKYLNFNFERISSAKNKITNLIVTVRDVTRQVLLAKQLKEEEARRERLLQLIVNILEVEPVMLNEFNESTQRELAFIDQIINQHKPETYHEMLIKAHRAMHLIKGNAKLLNIDYFADKAHAFEDLIVEVQKNKIITGQQLMPLKEKLIEMESGLEEIERVIERMGKIHNQKDSRKGIDTNILLQSLENLINSYSKDLGKKIKFDYNKFEGRIIPEKYFLLVKEVLVQLIRNSIAHGIEYPEERKSLRKPQYGYIEISTFKKNSHIGFRLRDDGKGIQLEKLKEKALQSGRWLAEEIESWDNQQVAQLIFESGISTSDRVDMISGRGMGMDGIKQRINEHHGNIQVSFAEGQFCEFQIILPLSA